MTLKDLMHQCYAAGEERKTGTWDEWWLNTGINIHVDALAEIAYEVLPIELEDLLLIEWDEIWITVLQGVDTNAAVTKVSVAETAAKTAVQLFIKVRNEALNA